jgi:hypothetical protein
MTTKRRDLLGVGGLTAAADRERFGTDTVRYFVQSGRPTIAEKISKRKRMKKEV